MVLGKPSVCQTQGSVKPKDWPKPSSRLLIAGDGSWDESSPRSWAPSKSCADTYFDYYFVRTNLILDYLVRKYSSGEGKFHDVNCAIDKSERIERDFLNAS